MICWERVFELREEVGEDDLSEIVSLFLEETEVALGQLREATSPDEAEALLHTLKGSALNLGFHEMGKLCSGPGGSGVEGQEVERIVAVFESSKAELLAAL
jgi:histidine phosphotransfer protein HptB